MEWTGIEKKDFVALPSGAVAGGCTEEGETTYVARCDWGSDAACGAYIPSKRIASIPYGSRERLHDASEVLVCHDPEILFWTDAENGAVPDLAVAINMGVHHEKLIYVARTKPNTSLTGLRNLSGFEIKVDKNFKGPMLGKLHPSHQTMYLAHGGSEYFVHQYQVLCAYIPPTVKSHIQSPYTWVPASNGYIPENGLTGGRTENDEPTFVARIRVPPEEYVLYEAGYVVPSKKLCYYSGVMEDFATTNSYEVFVTPNAKHFSWSPGVVDNSCIVHLNQIKTSYVGRTKPGFKSLKDHSCQGELKLNLSDDKLRIVGSVRHYSESESLQCLHVVHNKNLFIFSEFETLVASTVQNTLQELCRYAVLQWTSGVPSRINRLPLPERMKEFCQLREEEKKRVPYLLDEYWYDSDTSSC